MASFQAKVGWKRPRKRENKILVPFRSYPTLPVIENSEKVAKQFKKLKNMIAASYLAKVVGKIVRKRENKNYHSVSFLPDE